MKLLSIDHIPGAQIEALGMVKGTVVYSKNLGRDFMAGMKTLVGGEIVGYTEMIVEARAIATKRMVDEAEALGADQVFGGCLPAEKVKTVRKLKETGRVLFVGDGVNDAPVLAAADAGAAMGALGSDAAIEAADVVIMDDQPAKAALLISACQRILKVARQNIVFAIGIKALTLILGAFGRK